MLLSGPFFRLAFVFSINSLTMSGFPLTFFDLAEASLSAFSWLYTLGCAVVQKYHEILLFIIIHIFSTYFAISLFYLHNLKTQMNYGTTTALCMWMNEIKTKTKPSHVTFKLITRYIFRFSSQTMQWYH